METKDTLDIKFNNQKEKERKNFFNHEEKSRSKVKKSHI